MLDSLLTANKAYAADFDLGHLTATPSERVALVTCMDTRIDPLAIFGLRPGQVKVLRNAGGRVTPDVLRTLTLATTVLGVTQVAVVHHTGCALAGIDEEAVRAPFSEAQREATRDWDFRSMPDPDAALAADVLAIRSSAALPPGTVVEGWRYDVDTGRVHRVVT